MRLPLLALVLLAAGCRSAAVPEPPSVPPAATTLVLASDEPPRVLYASAWGAFAAAGWEVVEHDSDALRFTVQTAATDGALAVRVEEEPGHPPTARLETGAAEHDLLAAAADVLASVPGRFTFR